jgi:hypothetical protein
MKGKNKQKTTTIHMLGKSPHSLHPKEVRSSSMTLMANSEWIFGVCVRVPLGGGGDTKHSISLPPPPSPPLPCLTSLIKRALSDTFLDLSFCGLFVPCVVWHKITQYKSLCFACFIFLFYFNFFVDNYVYPYQFQTQHRSIKVKILKFYFLFSLKIRSNYSNHVVKPLNFR